MLTRKQVWRKAKLQNYYFYNKDDKYNYFEIDESIPVKKKGVKFSNVVKTILIPTNDENNFLYNYYNAHLYFTNTDEKINENEGECETENETETESETETETKNKNE